jgi:site-specific DNA-methyltransferase (adenine-specific)
VSAPAPYWASEDGDVVVHLGDCLDVLRTLEADSIDAIVTDPPAGIAFMGRDWDDFRRARWRFTGWLAERMSEALRVLKPGGHLLVWSLPRTSHWTAWALEDAGLEIRDCILHLFGSGFPKSLDVSKAIDRAAGAGRQVVGRYTPPNGKEWNLAADESMPGGGGTMGKFGLRSESMDITAPATPDAARWEGWGTALKPGQEMWWLARKPLKGTVAASVLEYGTGALNIGGCKVAHASEADRAGYEAKCASVVGLDSDRNGAAYGTWSGVRENSSDGTGRWPANVVFTHSAACEMTGARQVRNHGHGPAARGSGGIGTAGHRGQEGLTERREPYETAEAWACAPDCPVGELDRQSGVKSNGSGQVKVSSGRKNAEGSWDRQDGGMFDADRENTGIRDYGDSGGASRFYPVFRYQAKAPASERPRLEDGTAHETVKPLGLMTWLVRLITPPGGTVLDLFAGSGPVAEACIIEGFRCVLIEQDPKSAALIRKRLGKPIQPVMFAG